MPGTTPGPRCPSALPSVWCWERSWFPKGAAGGARRHLQSARQVSLASWHQSRPSAKPPLQAEAKQMPDRQTPPPTAESAGPAQPADERVREVSGLATYLQSLAEREKAEIARTLHDELGGLLTAAKMDLSWLQSRVPAPELQERLAQLGSVLDEAMDLKRRLVDDLR